MLLVLILIAICVILYLVYGATIILGVLLALIALLCLYSAISRQINFYKHSDCSICGNPTGIKGNRRFKLADGCMCERCAENYVVRKGPLSNGQGPAAFAEFSVEEVQARIRRREEIGEEQWQEEYKAEQAEKSRLYLKELEEERAKNAPAKPVDTTPKCPHCGSTSLSADKKGFGVGKAAVGAAIAGPIGLATGAKDSNKVILTCLNCGFQWKAGQYKK